MSNSPRSGHRRLTWLHRQGSQGTFDAASNGTLESEFNTSDEDEVIKKILEEGTMQTMEVSRSMLLHATHMDCRRLTGVLVQMPSRQGVTNESMSSMRTH